MASLPEYEKLSSFYLGKAYDLANRRTLVDKLLYDSKDLTTHALCVGMTGSGKTGLCLSMLEEAALDGIPAICVDPKGDLGNLLLAFPNLAPGDFQAWLDPAEASRRGLQPEQLAVETATRWREGLAAWDQQAERIERYRSSVDMAIYTPGSNAGIPLSVLKSFDAPSQQVIADAEILRERVTGAASGLLTLLGIDADPLNSREHILLSNIFDISWRQGQNLDLPALIHAIQSPPLEKVGVFDLETFYPGDERKKLSMTLNNLLASPAFAGWLEGNPLDIRQLLYTAQGKPRLSIISIAHLNDSERMFFVTVLLNELLAWMRSQAGTSSLRALFYMDEIFGYFPPTAKPPSKSPMLLLLKQARAFGLGIVLATQNPVDLDYRGLSNIGTWFLGRLQTARDKERVLSGLEGAAAQTGTRFDRSSMEQTLAALESRVFLMNNVHDVSPTIFQTRWALSYLRGPLTRQQIQLLMDPRRAELTARDPARLPSPEVHLWPTANAASATANRPLVPHDVQERFWKTTYPLHPSFRYLYRPVLLAQVSCHYVRVSADIDTWIDRSLVVSVNSLPADDVWQQAQEIPSGQLQLSLQPQGEFSFSDVPAVMLNAKHYTQWAKDVADHCYRRMPETVFACAELKLTSRIGQDELDARMAWGQQAREMRDREKEALREKYATKVDRLSSRIRAAQTRLEREESQFDKEKWNVAVNVGHTMLGWLMGNKVSARGATAGRSLSRAAQERGDIRQAADSLEQLLLEKQDLDQQCEAEISQLAARFHIEALTLEPLQIPCRKGDIRVNLLALLWVPWQIDSHGQSHPLVPLMSPKTCNSDTHPTC